MSAHIGVTGLAVMGANLARNLARNGFTVALHNRSVEKTDALLAKHGTDGEFIRTETLQELVDSLEKPRRVLIMGKAGKPFVDVVVDAAGQKGTGRWTVISALELGSPVSGIAESVFARALSSQAAQRKLGQELLAGNEADVEIPETFVEDVRQALYASKLVSYAQGLDMLTSAAKEYNWDLKLDEIASLWRAGCIIRAELLKDITKAYAADEKPANLLFAPAFTEAIAAALPAWRRVVATAVQLGIPVPVFSSSLAYYDGLRRKRVAAALIQGQRDLFGAHTYGRVDAEGTFHTLWGEDKSEIEAVDTH